MIIIAWQQKAEDFFCCYQMTARWMPDGGQSAFQLLDPLWLMSVIGTPPSCASKKGYSAFKISSDILNNCVVLFSNYNTLYIANIYFLNNIKKSFLLLAEMHLVIIKVR
ncbi:hypothetical protein BDC45DRAFT_529467 [Circinella umbellata]|nr:hypothetical protein BDC45DRAFT_529467 [Circinella umbellata]